MKMSAGDHILFQYNTTELVRGNGQHFKIQDSQFVG